MDDCVAAQNPCRSRLRYLPVEQLAPGMALAESLDFAERNIVRHRLPDGHVLTPEDVQQLDSSRTDLVRIVVPDARSDEEIAAAAAFVRASVEAIFAGADLGQPALAALFERVLAYRSQ
ncbi:hypothetical protein [Rhodocyclus tenuis]|uniref:hypothetical protein n=1 Tax=Rhodocyclus tenuis TaxID=1066 RepID=UPI00190661A5|nr:hypothetical protein [Rhodocyclus tenuis]